jgi:hypothetical protein
MTPRRLVDRCPYKQIRKAALKRYLELPTAISATTELLSAAERIHLQWEHVVIHRLTVLGAFLALSIGMTEWAVAQAPPKQAAGPSPIATTDSETPGVQLQVMKLKRSGDSVLLQFVLVNNSDSNYDTRKLDSSSHSSADGVYLLDTPGKKKYEVVRDSNSRGVCSQDLPQLAAKSSLNVWAKFPAPPDSVKKIGIVAPHFMPMDDVPLSQ